MTVHATPRQATAACVCRFSFLPNLTDATNATNATTNITSVELQANAMDS